MKFLSTFLFVLLPACMLWAGTLQLSRDGERYNLTADQVILSDILAEIDRQEPAALKFYGDYPQSVTATYRDVTLDQLLYKLGVSYVLTYEEDADGNYQLGDAMMLDSDAHGVDAGTAEKMRKLVRNLRSDDKYYNAHAAYDELVNQGCAAVPFLEEGLLSDDFQGRQVAANILRYVCPELEPGDRLIDVTFELLDGDGFDYGEHGTLISGWGAYTFLDQSNVYSRARNRILANLQSNNPRVRLYSALLAAEKRELTHINTMTRILIPHLADNDLSNDAAAATHALHALGPSILPQLQHYRQSTDQQQAELVDLICRALETGESPASFTPVMYVGYSKNPVADRDMVNVLRWDPDQFPDSEGSYHNLEEPRQTAADYYGTNWQVE